MIKAAGIILCEIFIFLLLKKYSPEYALLSEIITGVILFFLVSSEIKNTVSSFGDMFSRAGIGTEYIRILFRAAGISLITAFASELCRDAGENAAAVNTEFTGKVLIISCALPLLDELTGFIIKMVENV